VPGERDSVHGLQIFRVRFGARSVVVAGLQAVEDHPRSGRNSQSFMTLVDARISSAGTLIGDDRVLIQLEHRQVERDEFAHRRAIGRNVRHSLE
jgi:hypothetical protein